jgi:hypothetical protein
MKGTGLEKFLRTKIEKILSQRKKEIMSKIKEAILANPNGSLREIAREAGCSHVAVLKAKKRLGLTGGNQTGNQDIIVEALRKVMDVCIALLPTNEYRGLSFEKQRKLKVELERLSEFLR